MLKKMVALGFAVMALASVAIASAASSDAAPAPQNGQYYCPGPQRGCGAYAQNGNGNGYYCGGPSNNAPAQK